METKQSWFCLLSGLLIVALGTVVIKFDSIGFALMGVGASIKLITFFVIMSNRSTSKEHTLSKSRGLIQQTQQVG